MNNSSNHSLNKVPLVTLFFWIIKIMATTVGETAADYLNFNLKLGLGVTSILMTVLLAVFLIIQVKQKKYIPWIYWVNVLFISVAGTLITDNLVDNMGISLEVTTLAFSLLLAWVFYAWYQSEKTLSILSINTRKREIYYWLTILLTFALGTSAGDLFSEGLKLGYLLSTIIFAFLIGLVLILRTRFNLSSVISFWIAYILTRPLGASFADYLAQPLSYGGLGFGMEKTSVVFLVAIICVVLYLTVSKKDLEIANK